jgi:exo-1,4-beta-D-glucosaminidase
MAQRKRDRLLKHACLAMAALLVTSSSPMAFSEEPETGRALGEGWHIRSSQETRATGAEISQPGFDVSGWQPTSVPSTVLAALVRNGVYEDPYFGRNLEQIPRELFASPWWYRTDFTLAEPSPSHVGLVFEGINYSADVWLNGRKIADRKEIVGAFRIFELDISKWAVPGRNVLALEVVPPKPGDFTIGFVDWNPTPPDRNMGLWRGVKLRSTGAVSLRDTFVTTRVDLETLSRATLTISATLTNHGGEAAAGRVTAEIDGVAFDEPFELAPLEEKQIRLSPGDHPELVLDKPRLWWPNQLGEPHLYSMTLRATVGEAVSDQTSLRFGVREVSDYLNEQGHRGYKVNGQPVLIRGGGWVDDLLLDDDARKLEDQIRYARHMNLNTIRLEGFWGRDQRLYELADEYGLLIMAGWSCQWEWEEYLGKPVDEEFGGITTPEEMQLVSRSLADQVRWLRNHPSIFVWVLGSDMLPRPELERKYRDELSSIDTTRPLLAACKLRTSDVSGSTAVKMEGPYDYVTPNYWYVDKKHGGAFGFNTETGPGPQPPPIESIRRMIPEPHLWPIDEMWHYHCGRNEFNTLDRYHNALDKRYGPSSGVEEFARKAQLANYEAMRAMFEAFAANRPSATGVIQWMLNSAWPEMYWQLYDYYLMPNGAFYGARTAAEPLNILYNYGDRSVYVTNDTLSEVQNVTAEVRLLDLGSKERFSRKLTVDLAPGRPQRLLELPETEDLTPVYFLDLKLRAADDGIVGRNFYWLSTKPDVLDEEGTEWFYTPNKSFADFTALGELPPVALQVRGSLGTTPGEPSFEVELQNPTDALAFFVELRLVDPATGHSILPVLWDDNYVSLLPGETRSIRARFPGTTAEQLERARLEYSGWNVKHAALILEVKVP